VAQNPVYLKIKNKKILPQQRMVSDKSSSKSTSEAAVRLMWQHADAVCFDIDSTVCQDEAIDELADFCGVGEEVAAYTRKAMNGGVTFREALRARLDLIQPSIFQMQAYIRNNPPRLTPGIKELVAELHKRKVDVYLVSGGFAAFIRPVARLLGIPEENVYANILLFDDEGNYAGFDESQPTSDSIMGFGKGAVCNTLKNRMGYKRLFMVGDGSTDMEACPPADAFIGFGGNAVRERVKNGAPWFVMSFDEMLTEFKKAPMVQ